LAVGSNATFSYTSMRRRPIRARSSLRQHRLSDRLDKEFIMNTRLITTCALTSIALSLGACSSMSARDKNTAVGAAIGGVAGSVLTGGSTAGTVGGAAVGGVIGNQVDPKKK
jgi:osmotically inducible lipoprotein OsmB